MAGLNKVMLIGRIGKDPDTFTFDNGNKKISFTLATTESYRDRDNNWVDQTEWHNITGYRFLAEKNFAKGDLVYIEGKIKTRKYTDKDGSDRYITEIQAEKINILNRRSSEGYDNSAASGGQSYQEPPSEADLHNESGEDDLPF
ncbi:MAG: single-stranded DNA-binding protein [Bacteroidales bacterium]|nr:single-stranded DNA-binding protein [Bacteroidales bacterium]